MHVSRIPPEIWINVFLHALLSSESYDFRLWVDEHQCSKYKITDPSLLPLLLSSVCWQWRAIAHDMHRLWQTCWINYRHPEANQIWIRRAKAHPLTLYGQWPRKARHMWDNRVCEEASSALLNSILPYQNCWKYVRLDVTPIVLPKSVAEELLNGVSFPILESLEILYNVGERGAIPIHPAPNDSWVMSLLRNAHHLERLVVRCTLDADLDERMSPSLVYLEIEFINTAEALRLLHALPQLRGFSVRIGQWLISDTISPLTHHNLAHLCLGDGFNEESYTPSLLSFLTLPHLTSLHIMTYTSTAAMIDMLNRSGCHIFELEISGQCISDIALTTILKHDSINSWLETLKFRHFSLTGPVLTFLRNAPVNEYLVRLACLSIQDA